MWYFYPHFFLHILHHSSFGSLIAKYFKTFSYSHYFHLIYSHFLWNSPFYYLSRATSAPAGKLSVLILLVISATLNEIVALFLYDMEIIFFQVFCFVFTSFMHNIRLSWTQYLTFASIYTHFFRILSCLTAFNTIYIITPRCMSVLNSRMRYTIAYLKFVLRC
jgi:hypothetical protein